MKKIMPWLREAQKQFKKQRDLPRYCRNICIIDQLLPIHKLRGHCNSQFVCMFPSTNFDPL